VLPQRRASERALAADGGIYVSGHPKA
jgi:hypothetical protein